MSCWVVGWVMWLRWVSRSCRLVGSVDDSVDGWVILGGWVGRVCWLDGWVGLVGRVSHPSTRQFASPGEVTKIMKRKRH